MRDFWQGFIIGSCIITFIGWIAGILTSTWSLFVIGGILLIVSALMGIVMLYIHERKV